MQAFEKRNFYESGIELIGTKDIQVSYNPLRLHLGHDLRGHDGLRTKRHEMPCNRLKQTEIRIARGLILKTLCSEGELEKIEAVFWQFDSQHL